MRAIILLFLLLFVPIIKAEQSIVLSNGEWKPYISQEYPHFGPYSQIVSEAFALKGIKVQYQFYTWNRAVYMADIGTVNGTIAITDNKQRREKFWYSKEPVIVGERVFFYLKDNAFNWNQMDDLKAVKIGATIEYFYGNALENKEKEGTLNVQRVISDKLNFKKLLAKRIDIFPITKEVGYHILKSEFSWEEYHQVTHHQKPLSTTPFYIIMSKKLPQSEGLMKMFDEGFQQLKASGRYDEILDMIQ